MSTYTFRTEGPGDRVGAEKMIDVLSLSLVKHWQEGESKEFAIDLFTVESDDDLEVVRDRMMLLVKRDNECFKAGESYDLLPFVDLKRCAQTLNYGLRPKGPYTEPFKT